MFLQEQNLFSEQTSRGTIPYTWKQEIKNFSFIERTKLRDVFLGKGRGEGRQSTQVWDAPVHPS